MDFPRGYSPGFFAKSAQATESKTDEPSMEFKRVRNQLKLKSFTFAVCCTRAQKSAKADEPTGGSGENGQALLIS
jgi:hypothetical protein